MLPLPIEGRFKLEQTKEKRISAEKRRLKAKYKDLPKDTLAIVEGLLDEAAFMRIELADMKRDMIENGRVELFTQSEKTEPYERERPVVRQYTQMIRNYQNALKLLDEKLPAKAVEPVDDGFDSFVGGS